MKTLKVLLSIIFFFINMGTAFGNEGRLPYFEKKFPKKHCKNSKKYRNYDFKNDSLKTENGNEGYKDYAKEVKRHLCYKDWTVLVYMAGDNDLSPYSLWDVYEMERKIKSELNLGASTKDADIVVELDTFNRSGVRRLHLFQTNKEYDSTLTVDDFKMKKESDIDSPIVKLYKETGRGSLRNAKFRFERFLRWGRRQYPSENIMVVIWGHGEGYIGKHFEKSFKREAPPRNSSSNYLNSSEISLGNTFDKIPTKYPIDKVFGGIAFDFSDYTFLDLPTLSKIFEESNEYFWGKGGKKIDIIAMDACLMQSIEVGIELRNSSEYIVGSTQIQNYLGLPYRKILDAINQESPPSAFQLVKQLPNLADSSFKEGYQGKVDPKAYETFTASTLSTWQLRNNLLPKIMQLGYKLESYLDEEPLRVLEMGFLLENSPTFQGETRDIGIFLGTLKKLLYEEKMGLGLQSAKAHALDRHIDVVMDGISQTMMSYAYGSNYVDQGPVQTSNYLLGFFKGLSIWIPSSKGIFDHRIKEFEQSIFYRSQFTNGHQNPWRSWLEKALDPMAGLGDFGDFPLIN
ncbi:MAG: hypothetical protein HN509_03505 [Halobacteriovoraceae bacterium]|jgi:hypothetical protein|nr:hypothetical protein [Halobacteriovoraceae bacterium]MBT5094395.1 hypothetical protein [Halobacteriovoraceae bacterium]